MIKTVLCAVDINRPKEEAGILKMAARLADLDGAQLDVISVVPDFGASVVGAYLQDHHVTTARDNAAERLRALCEDALGAERNKTVRHVVAVGSVYKEVLRAAEVDNVDLIVLGAHGPDLRDYLLGPNASRIVRHGKCSVFVVRNGQN